MGKHFSPAGCLAIFFGFAIGSSSASAQGKSCNAITNQMVEDMTLELLGCAKDALLDALTLGFGSAAKPAVSAASLAKTADKATRLAKAKELAAKLASLYSNSCRAQLLWTVAYGQYRLSKVSSAADALTLPPKGDGAASLEFLINLMFLKDAGKVSIDAAKLALDATTLRDIAKACAKPSALISTVKELGPIGTIAKCALTIGSGALMLGEVSVCTFQALELLSASKLRVKEQIEGYSKGSSCGSRLFRLAQTRKEKCETVWRRTTATCAANVDERKQQCSMLYKDLKSAKEIGGEFGDLAIGILKEPPNAASDNDYVAFGCDKPSMIEEFVYDQGLASCKAFNGEKGS